MDQLTRDFYVAIGKVQSRSDVHVSRYRRVHPQPSKKVELEDHVRALFDRIGATCFFYELAEQGGCSGVNLRAPSSKGFWDASFEPPTTWPWRDGQHLGHPGEQVAIIEGADEAGVLLRKEGGFATFDSDGEAQELTNDFGWLQRGIDCRFAAGWDTARGPDPTIVARLQTEVPRRTTIEVTLAKVERLDADAARAWRLGAMHPVHFNTVMKALGLKADGKALDQQARGERLAEAITDSKAFDAKTRKAMLKPFGGKMTVAAFKERFLLDGSPPLTRCTAELAFRTKAAVDYSLRAPLVARVLLDAGVSFPGLDEDAVRYTAMADGEVLPFVPTVDVLQRVSRRAPAIVCFTLTDQVEHTLEEGQHWESAAIEPFSICE